MTSFAIATVLKINVACSLTLLSARKSKRFEIFNEAVCSNANAGQIRDSQAKSGQLSVPGEVSIFPGHPVKIGTVLANPGRMVTLPLVLGDGSSATPIQCPDVSKPSTRHQDFTRGLQVNPVHR